MNSQRNVIMLFLIILTGVEYGQGYLSSKVGRAMIFNCPENKNCSCFPSFNDHWIQCPGFKPEIIIRIQPKKVVQVECTADNQGNYKYLPTMNIGEVPEVQIKRCPLPTYAPIQDILDQLGIKLVRGLYFQSYGAQLNNTLTRQQFKGLNTLEKLVLNQNDIVHLSEDAFVDTKNLTALDLSSNNINFLYDTFANLKNLTYLNLGKNRLTNWSPGIFRNQVKIESLNLSGNRLKNVSKEMMEDLVSVKHLDLSLNYIEVLKSDVFTPLRNLSTLSLNKNNFTNLPKGLFKENHKLAIFTLLENYAELSSLPPRLLSNLSELKEIRIRCQLRSIPGDLLSRSSNLRRVVLSQNSIETLPSTLFADQSSLTDIDLSHNKLTDLPEDLFKNLRSLLVLSLSHNQLVNIPRVIFNNLQVLREVYLNDNKIFRIHSDTFINTRSLQIIHLQNNMLSFKDEDVNFEVYHYDLASPFQLLTELRNLNLRNNCITNIYRDWIFNLKQLQVLDLSQNNISRLYYNDLQFSSQRIIVNLTNNLISSINFRDVEVLNYENETRKIVISVDSNPLICDCTLLKFVQFLRGEIATKTRRVLEVSANNLQCVSPSNLKGTQVADIHPKDLLCPLDSALSPIKECPKNCTCHVRLLDKALIVNCSKSNPKEITYLPEPHPHQLSFIELYIENNNITELPTLNVSGYSAVKRLYARNNQIRQISLDNIPNSLEILDLANNNLRSIDEPTISILNQTKIKKLYLAKNPWICNCHSSSLVSFIRTSFKKIDDVDGMQCNSGVKMATILPGDLCTENERLFIISCIIIATISLCVGVLAALYYKYQQEVKVWLFAHNMCLWFVTEEELDKDKKYDAFISYSHKDEDFVIEHLVPGLENAPNPFKLCLHIRDWVVGEFIPNQIAKSVEDSRRTIVVLSPNFLESIWGRMEFRAAHTAALSEGRARVIVIIYGDIGETDHLDTELKAYLKMNTYVKWGDPWFWDKLRYALPHQPTFAVKNTIYRETISQKDEVV